MSTRTLCLAAALLSTASPSPADDPKPTPKPTPPAASAPPRRLPTGLQSTAKSIELGALQRKYRKLLELGLVEEALDVARELGRPPEVVRALATEAADKSKTRPTVVKASADGSVMFAKEGPSDWDSIRDLRLGCDFRGATAKEVAAYFHRETGLTIHVECETGVSAKAVHLLVRDRPAMETITQAFEAVGLSCEFRDGRLSATTRKPTR